MSVSDVQIGSIRRHLLQAVSIVPSPAPTDEPELRRWCQEVCGVDTLNDVAERWAKAVKRLGVVLSSAGLGAGLRENRLKTSSHLLVALDSVDDYARAVLCLAVDHAEGEATFRRHRAGVAIGEPLSDDVRERAADQVVDEWQIADVLGNLLVVDKTTFDRFISALRTTVEALLAANIARRDAKMVREEGQQSDDDPIGRLRAAEAEADTVERAQHEEATRYQPLFDALGAVRSATGVEGDAFFEQWAELICHAGTEIEKAGLASWLAELEDTLPPAEAYAVRAYRLGDRAYVAKLLAEVGKRSETDSAGRITSRTIVNQWLRRTLAERIRSHLQSEASVSDSPPYSGLTQREARDELERIANRQEEEDRKRCDVQGVTANGAGHSDGALQIEGTVADSDLPGAAVSAIERLYQFGKTVAQHTLSSPGQQVDQASILERQLTSLVASCYSELVPQVISFADLLAVLRPLEAAGRKLLTWHLDAPQRAKERQAYFHKCILTFTNCLDYDVTELRWIANRGVAVQHKTPRSTSPIQTKGLAASAREEKVDSMMTTAIKPVANMEARETVSSRPLSRLDLPYIIEAIQESYRIIETPPAADWSAPSWLIEQYERTTAGEAHIRAIKQPNHSWLIASSATEVLNRIMPPWNHSKEDCPEITQSLLDHRHKVKLIELRNLLLAPFLGNTLASNRSESLCVLEFLESVIKTLTDQAEVATPVLPDAESGRLTDQGQYPEVSQADTRLPEIANKSDTTKDVEAQVKVDRWSDLSIGIDIDGFLAFVPCPNNGDRVSKSKGIRLALPGNRWPIVLQVLAASNKGNAAPIRELLDQLGYLKRQKVVISDEQAERDEKLGTRAKTAKRTLTARWRTSDANCGNRYARTTEAKCFLMRGSNTSQRSRSATSFPIKTETPCSNGGNEP